MLRRIKPRDMVPGQTVEVKHVESGVLWFAEVTEVNRAEFRVSPEGASRWEDLWFTGSFSVGGDYQITRIIR